MTAGRKFQFQTFRVHRTITLRPRPQVYPDIFKSATFSFRLQKYFHPHVAYSNRICPSTRIRNVSGFTLVLRTPQGNRGNRAYAMKPSAAILKIDFTVRNWARSCYVIRIKKHPNLASTRIGNVSGFTKVVSGKKKVADSGYVWTEP